MMRTAIVLVTLLIVYSPLYAQDKSVAITMDDLLYAYNGMNIENVEKASDGLIDIIIKLHVPVTVFVNEKSFMKFGEIDRRLSLYKNWIDNPLITIGNHTYSHQNYATSTFTEFLEDIVRGEAITEELLKGTDKKLKYFRFPYNCTGIDSISKTNIYRFLNDKRYIITPFTIESMDYVFNSLYSYYIKCGQEKEAEEIIEQYIDYTVEIFDHYEMISNELYGRNIRHIYLCHTNQLNSACFGKLIEKLKENGYGFCSLDKALNDTVFRNKDYYSGQYGFSWMYRWIEDSEKRIELMKKEPEPEAIIRQYQKVIK